MNGKNTYWLEIEGRTDDILEFDNNTLIAPMSFYKILQEIEEITKFQLIQKAKDKLELRIMAKEKEKAFPRQEDFHLIPATITKITFTPQLFLPSSVGSINTNMS